MSPHLTLPLYKYLKLPHLTLRILAHAAYYVAFIGPYPRITLRLLAHAAYYVAFIGLSARQAVPLTYP